MRSLSLVVVAVAGIAALEAHAQQGRNPGAEQYELRTYDIADLILTIHDHPYPGEPSKTTGRVPSGSFGGSGGGLGANVQDPRSPVQFAQFGGGGGEFGRGGGRGYGPPAAANETNGMNVTVDDVMGAIVETIEPETWEEKRGGAAQGAGRIARVGAALVIWQTQQVHEQIAELLRALHSSAGSRKTLRIDARWLLLTSDELDALLSGENSSVDRKTLDRLTRRPTSIRGVTNCFSGQLTYLVSGTRRNVVQGYIPVVGSIDSTAPDATQWAGGDGPVISLVSEQTEFAPSRGVGYQPLVSTPNFGALLEIRPTLVHGDDRVTVDLKSTITALGAPDDAAANQWESTGGAPAVDRSAIETQEFATTLRTPLGEPLLVGGMTCSPGVGEFDPAGTPAGESREAPQLYLVLEVQ
ncbi:MAG: hypothetical protein KDA44_06015 [Planctomycetales bacterium]|nr:hypothetical protein [Planctomycetales bacterium]